MTCCASPTFFNRLKGCTRLENDLRKRTVFIIIKSIREKLFESNPFIRRLYYSPACLPFNGRFILLDIFSYILNSVGNIMCIICMSYVKFTPVGSSKKVIFNRFVFFIHVYLILVTSEIVFQIFYQLPYGSIIFHMFSC